MKEAGGRGRKENSAKEKVRSKKLQPGYGRGGREGDGDIELVESVYKELEFP